MPAQPRILVMEEDLNLRCTLSEILRLAGYLVVAFERAEDLLRYAERYACDLILIDIDCLRGNQTYLLNEIYCLRPTVSVLMLAASPTIESSDIFEPLDRVDYIFKPVAPMHILARISGLLR